jgi:hypothetical protein
MSEAINLCRILARKHFTKVATWNTKNMLDNMQMVLREMGDGWNSLRFVSKDSFL